jgi:hypothetical protein
MRLLLIILLIVALCGGIGGPYVGAPWPREYGFGGVGVILVILVILALLGYL